MTKAKVKKSTKKLYSSRRKAIVGQFKVEKICGVTVTYKHCSDGTIDGPKRSYWGGRTKETIVVSDGKVHGYVAATGYYQTDPNSTIDGFVETLEEFNNGSYYDLVVKVNIVANYKRDEFTHVSYRSKDLNETQFTAELKRLKKANIDFAKARVYIKTLTFRRDSTYDEQEALDKIDAQDLAAKEAEKKRIAKEEAARIKRAEKREKERQIAEAAIKAEQAAAKKRAKVMEDQGDLAYALSILKEKGLEVVIVKDGSSKL